MQLTLNSFFSSALLQLFNARAGEGREEEGGALPEKKHRTGSRSEPCL